LGDWDLCGGMIETNTRRVLEREATSWCAQLRGSWTFRFDKGGLTGAQNIATAKRESCYWQG
jgi:hypothetical protein